MLLTLVAAISLQVATPMLPAGVSPTFQAKVLEVEGMLQRKDFDAASRLLATMPANNVSVQWDDSAAPPELKAGYVNAREIAFQFWSRFMPGVTFSLANDAPLRFSFTDKNPIRPGTDLPMGASLTFDAKGATAVIGLNRGKPSQATSAFDVQRDVSFVLAQYFGLGDIPLGSSASIPIDIPLVRGIPVNGLDARIALGNLSVLSALRKAVANQEAVEPATSEIKANLGDLDVGTVIKGQKKSFTVEVENTGKAPLALWVRPECGCMAANAPETIAPGSKQQVELTFDSTDFVGKTERRVYFVTNDPKQPVIHLSTFFFVKPPYRFLTTGAPVAVLGEKGGFVDVFLTFDDRAPYGIRATELNGFEGEVSMTPWQGTMADPEMGELAKPRKGYKFHIKVPGPLPPGRSPGTLMVSTDSPDFPLIQAQVYAQKGIVALPDELFLGNLTGPRTAKVLISRPGKALKILSATSSSPNLTVQIKPGASDQEFVLEVAYDGKAASGDFNPVITVKTDDPKQPVVKIPVVGSVP